MKKIIFTIILTFTTICVYAQNRTISGVVLDETNEPFVGASVIQENTTNGVITDTNGKFIIVIPKEDTNIVVNFIGYQTLVTKITSQTTLPITLKLIEEEKKLEEVVVVGYGQQSKVSVVGAVSVVDNSDLKIATPANLTNAIAGRVTGAIVRMSDGNIGGGSTQFSGDGTLADAQIFIRGKATTNSASPLILVDGIESSFSSINPDDIEQMSVLKDASATAVYGVRGANGVILITTKRGTLGKPKVSAKAEYRIHKPLNFPDFLGAYEYAYLYNEASRNMGIPEKYTIQDLTHWKNGTDPYGHPDTNWKDLLVKDHFSEQQASFNINGGTELVKYFISGEYLGAGGPFDGADLDTYSTNSSYKRYNLRGNFDFNLTKTTEIKIGLNGTIETKNDSSHGESSGTRYGGSFWWDIANLTVHEFPVINPDGTYNIGLPPSKSNVYGTLKSGGYRQREMNSFQTNIILNQKLDFILEGLSFRGMYGINFYSGSLLEYTIKPAFWSYFSDTDSYYLAESETTPKYVKSSISPLDKSQIEASISYDKIFDDTHKLGLMGVYIQTKTASAYNLPVNYQGLAARATYSLKNKYLAEFNMGYNGSDQFPKGNRFALLPAFSLGWIISEEAFIKDKIKFIDFLKLRGSYGTAGNDKIGSYRFLYDYKYLEGTTRWGAYTQYPGIYQLGETVQDLGKGIREGTLGNDNVTWEIAYKSNIGLDFTLFKQKLSGTIDLFHERREDILVVREDIPTQTGLLKSDLPAQNAGKVINKGYELSINYKDKLDQVHYSLGLNYSFARNKIDYIAEVEKKYDYQMQKGHPIGSFFGYTWTGKFYDYPDLEDPNIPKPNYGIVAGDLMFEDLNDDGVIDDYDKGVIGYPSIPEIVYGFNIGIQYKNIYANIFFQGASNVNSSYGNILMSEFAPNVQEIHKGRWVYDPARGLDTRAAATYPSLNVNGGSQATRELSTFKLVDSKYLRLKTIEIGYDFPKSTLSSLRLSGLRVYINGANLLTFNDYKPIDPEYYSGSSGAYFPQTKYYSVGLNLSF